MERMAEFTTSINFIAIYVESWKKFFDYKGRILREREREREFFSVPCLHFPSAILIQSARKFRNSLDKAAESLLAR